MCLNDIDIETMLVNICDIVLCYCVGLSLVVRSATCEHEVLGLNASADLIVFGRLYDKIFRLNISFLKFINNFSLCDVR